MKLYINRKNKKVTIPNNAVSRKEFADKYGHEGCYLNYQFKVQDVDARFEFPTEMALGALFAGIVVLTGTTTVAEKGVLLALIISLLFHSIWKEMMLVRAFNYSYIGEDLLTKMEPLLYRINFKLEGDTTPSKREIDDMIDDWEKKKGTNDQSAETSVDNEDNKD